MAVQRTDRLNSLLKEVIAEVIKRDVRNPHVSELVTVTRVQISKDLHHAKVYISIIGSEQDKIITMDALKTAAGFIAVNASQKVVMRYFPELTFKLDDSVEKHMRVEELLKKINDERDTRTKSADSDDESTDSDDDESTDSDDDESTDSDDDESTDSDDDESSKS